LNKYSHCKPANLTSIDPTSDFLELTKERLSNKVEFKIRSASNIPEVDGTWKNVVDSFNDDPLITSLK
jgi:hypothetical protein